MIGKLLGPELTQLIHRREFRKLRDILGEFQAPDIAEILSDIELDSDKAVLLRILPFQLAADVFEYLELEEQEKLLQGLGDRKVARILNEMTPDDRTAILEELPSAVSQKLLSLLSPEERKLAVDLLGYPEDSVGRRMTPEYAEVQKDWNVGQVLGYLRRAGRDRETLNQLFVLEADGKMAGFVRLRDLVVSELETPISELVEEPAATLRAFDDQETAVAEFKKYDQTALPVVDSRGVLVGVVTIDDMMDVADEEATEDFQKGMAISPLHTSIVRARFGRLYGSRVVWLVLLVFVNILSGAGIAHFEELIESVIALVFFLPLLIASSGNAGAQAATLVVRSMALGEVRPRDYLRVFMKELSVAVALGLTMAGAVFLVAWWRSGLTVGVVVAISMITVVLIGSLIGLSLPFILNRFKLDPATASAPLVTSLADVSGVIIYLTIAQWLLKMAQGGG